MTRTGIRRRVAVIAACSVTVLAAPTGAVALTTHSATDSTFNLAGQLVATAKCSAGEHVVSGGFKGSQLFPVGGAVVSRAVNGDSWTVHLESLNTGTLTTYAYCSRTLTVSKHEHEVTAVAAPRNTTATVRCASGETVVSGGYAFLPSNQVSSPTYRDYAASSRKWKVMSAFGSTPAKLAAFAYCMRGVVKVRSSSLGSIPNNSVGFARVSCHKRETLLGGGYNTTPRPNSSNVSGPDLIYGASYRSGPRSWTAGAANYSNVGGTITAFAYCAP